MRDLALHLSCDALLCGVVVVGSCGWLVVVMSKASELMCEMCDGGEMCRSKASSSSPLFPFLPLPFALL